MKIRTPKAYAGPFEVINDLLNLELLHLQENQAAGYTLDNNRERTEFILSSEECQELGAAFLAVAKLIKAKE